MTDLVLESQAYTYSYQLIIRYAFLYLKRLFFILYFPSLNDTAKDKSVILSFLTVFPNGIVEIPC